MKLGRVIGTVVSSDCHPAYAARKLLLVRPLTTSLAEGGGEDVLAIDYVQAGVGDVVLIGAAPGLASVVFGLKNAPIETLVMGIVDHVRADAVLAGRVAPPAAGSR